MKKNVVLANCPICDNGLEVKRLECSNCKTVIEGNFVLSKFNYLNKEYLYFIEVFIKNRGNIKLVEKELNVSYPTVKKMLDETIIGLGYQVEAIDEAAENKVDVLDQVKQGKISVIEAINLLKK